MTTTTVSDAVILPQSQGTGLSGENATIDAAINGVLNRYVGGEYVATEYSTGLQFQNHDGTNDTVEVGPGIVFIQDNSSSTGGERSGSGNAQAESSTTSGYDTELPEGHTYAVLLPTATEISVSDSTLNEVYVDIDDVTANNSVNLEHDGSTTASPGTTSLKIGETNPDDASADTRANDDASPTFDTLTVNGTTDTDALNADNLYSKSKTANYTVYKNGSSVRVDGPSGAVTTGSDLGVALNNLDSSLVEGDRVWVVPDDYGKVSPATITSAIHLESGFATVTLADDANDWIFTFNTPDDGSNSFNPRRRPLEVSGFYAKGNAANNNDSGFLHLAGAESNMEIHNNTMVNFAGADLSTAGILIGDSGDAHTAHVYANDATGMDGWFVRFVTGYNWAWGNDAGGGIRSAGKGTAFIQNNSVFDAVTKSGIYGSSTDVILGNASTGNDQHGIYLEDASDVTVVGNASYDNSKEADNTYSGLVLKGSSGTPAKNNLIACNRIGNVGENAGVQNHGIVLDGYLERVLVTNNQLRNNPGNAIHQINKNYTDVRAIDNLGFRSYNGGVEAFSGDGTQTTFSIPHFLDSEVKTRQVTPNKPDAVGDYHVEDDGSNLNIVYDSPPSSGSNNVSLSWEVDGRFL